MEIQNQVKNFECEKCKVKPQPGILIGNFQGFWLCGKCMLEAMNKLKEQSRKLILEE